MKRRFVTLALAALAASPAAPAAAAECGTPGRDFERRSPAAVSLDPAKLHEAIDFAMSRSTEHVAVYRGGCLAAEASTRPPDARYPSYSMAKSVTSMAAGRAFTEHVLAPDDRVGGVVPEADPAHGAVRMRHLLEMSSGLHWNFFRDYNVFFPRKRVQDALTLPFDHQPGTYFEYAQSPVTLAGEMVSRAAGEDLVSYVQREVMSPIGIAPDAWSWERDSTGDAMGFYGIDMRAQDWARLGHLMLRRGRWGSKRILSSRYVREASTPSPTNGGYGWFFWTNGGRSFVAPTADRRDVRSRRIVESAPPDMYLMAGLLEQRVIVIPSLDMTIVRLGTPGSRSGESDPFSLLLTTASAELEHELLRRVMAAVTDRRVPDPGPYDSKGPQEPAPTPDYGFLKSATQREDLDAARNEPPLPPAGPARARAAHTQRVRVRRGRVLLEISCPPVARIACRGPVTLRDGAGRVVGQARFGLAAGQRKAIRLRMSPSARRLVAPGRRAFIARSSTVSEDSLGGTANGEWVRVKPPKKQKKRR